jgi:lysophospholipase L1-like esterase
LIRNERDARSRPADRPTGGELANIHKGSPEPPSPDPMLIGGFARVRWLGSVALALSVASCGGGGGGGGGSDTPKGIGLEDLNGDGVGTVLCFGDSITREVEDGPSADSLPPAPAGYSQRLQPELALKTTLPLIVIDDGSPGERTPAGLNRLRGDLQDTNPDYTILLEGTNDVENGHTDDALGNMQRMIDMVIADGATPLLGTITPSCCNHQNQRPEPAILFYNGQLRVMAMSDEVPLIDFYAGFTGGPQEPYDSTLGLIHVPEGLHPTPARYDVIAATAQKIF